MNPITKIIVFSLLGLVMGSFVNAWVWRLSQQLNSHGEPKKLSAKKSKQLSVVTARSMCPNCKHVLGAACLVPVFSWLALGGKCLYCKKPISKQYPLVELLTALAFGVSAHFWVFGFAWQWAAFATWLAVLVGLVALAVYDLKYMVLPDRINYKMYSIATIGLLAQFMLGRPIGDLKQVVFSVVICGGIFWVLYQVSKGRWIGGGDVKLGFLLGLLIASGLLSFLMLFLASLLATAVSLGLIATKRIKRNAHIPFGPFLITATYIAVLFGQNIITWYQNLLFGSS